MAPPYLAEQLTKLLLLTLSVFTSMAKIAPACPIGAAAKQSTCSKVLLQHGRRCSGFDRHPLFPDGSSCVDRTPATSSPPCLRPLMDRQSCPCLG